MAEYKDKEIERLKGGRGLMIWIVIGFCIWLICDAYKDYKINKELADIKSELMQRSDNNA